LKNILVGGRVRVKPRSFLEQFQRESKYQHPISNEQLEAAGTTDTVKGAGIHRDGFALLELTATPEYGTKNVWSGWSKAVIGEKSRHLSTPFLSEEKAQSCANACVC
jgi:hypothetical protein